MGDNQTEIWKQSEFRVVLLSWCEKCSILRLTILLLNTESVVQNYTIISVPMGVTSGKIIFQKEYPYSVGIMETIHFISVSCSYINALLNLILCYVTLIFLKGGFLYFNILIKAKELKEQMLLEF